MEIAGQPEAEEAFTRQSAIFDAVEQRNPILKWMRKQVRDHVLKLLKPGSHILELNAGTGLDALFFASFGHTVLATDISGGMIGQIKNKVAELRLEDRIEALQCSYTQLQNLPSQSFDYVFSNFGGLNCIPDLAPVIQECKRLLKPGGRLTVVVMPKMSPWEILALLKGNTKLAFRRFKKAGAVSHIEGVYFTTWYFSPRKLIRQFGSDFKLIGWQGLGSLVPPPHSEKFPARFPVIFRLLVNIEERFSKSWPLRNWADHIILSMELKHWAPLNER